MDAYQQNIHVSKTSRWIKILAEIEKIWILYDLDGNESLDYEEIVKYLKTRAYPQLTLSDKQLETMFNEIDDDGNGTIDKSEMELFL